MKIFSAMIFSFFVCVSSVWAITLDDVIKLSDAGLGSDVIIKKIHSDGWESKVTTDDIVRLKKAEVSEDVIKALIDVKDDGKRLGEVSSGKAHIVFSHAGKKRISVLLNPKSSYIFYNHGHPLREDVLTEERNIELNVAAGTYHVRWAGEEKKLRLILSADEEYSFVTTQLESDEGNQLHLSVLKNEEEVIQGVLLDLTKQKEEAVVQNNPQPTQTVIYVPAQYFSPYYHACSYGNGYSPRYSRRGYKRYRNRWSAGNLVDSIGLQTIFWSGVGAVVGHQSDHIGEGAAIGAGFGYLLDQAD